MTGGQQGPEREAGIEHDEWRQEEHHPQHVDAAHALADGHILPIAPRVYAAPS